MHSNFRKSTFRDESWGENVMISAIQSLRITHEKKALRLYCYNVIGIDRAVCMDNNHSNIKIISISNDFDLEIHSDLIKT